MLAFRRHLSLILVALAIGIVGCKPHQEPPHPLEIGELPVVHGIGPEIADEKGYLRATGLTYNMVAFPTGPDIIAALRPADKGADAGVLAIVPVVTMINSGADPVVIATVLKSDRSVKLVSRADSHITSDPKSLRGHKIGVTKNTIGDLYLYRLLNKGGLNATNVQEVPGAPADLVNLLANGSVDAIITWDPFIASAARRLTTNGSAPLISFEPSLQHFSWHIVTTRSKLNSRRTQLLELIRGLVLAGDFVTGHPSDAEQLGEHWLNLGPGELADFFRGSDFRVELNMPDVTGQIADQLAWLRGSPSPKLDPQQYVDPTLLEEIDPKRVKR